MVAAHLFGSGAALLGVSVVLGGILGALVLLGRYLKGPSGSRGTVIPLTASHSLHVVEIEGRRLVVGTGPQGAPRLIDTLDALESELEVADGRDAPARATRPSFDRGVDAR